MPKKTLYSILPFIALVMLVVSVHAKTLEEGWVYAGSTTDGNDYFFQRKSIVIKPQSRTNTNVEILIQKKEKFLQKNIWNINCSGGEIEVEDGDPPRFKPKANSMANIFFKGFCGIRTENNHWFYIGAAKQNGVEYFFIDALSIRKSIPPEPEGVYLVITNAILDYEKINLKHKKTFELITSCETYKQLKYRERNSGDFLNLTIEKDNPTDTALDMACKDFFNFFAKTTRDNSVISDKFGLIPSSSSGLLVPDTSGSTMQQQYEPINPYFKSQNKYIVSQPELTRGMEKKSDLDNKAQLNSAKQKCLDLGFKEGTEKLGICALELSKD